MRCSFVISSLFFWYVHDILSIWWDTHTYLLYIFYREDISIWLVCILQMVHVSGFLKVAFGGIGGPNRNNLSCDVVSASNIDRYQVIGLVAECHLIESPVIMELTVERSTFTAMTSMDMKFTSVDTRYIDNALNTSCFSPHWYVCTCL